MTHPTTEGEASNALIPAQQTANLPTPPVFDTRVSPAALQELFSRDPEQLSDKDIETIVTELRASRQLFEQQEQVKALKEPRKKASPKKDVATINILDDLGL